MLTAQGRKGGGGVCDRNGEGHGGGGGWGAITWEWGGGGERGKEKEEGRTTCQQADGGGGGKLEALSVDASYILTLGRSTVFVYTTTGQDADHNPFNPTSTTPLPALLTPCLPVMSVPGFSNPWLTPCLPLPAPPLSPHHASRPHQASSLLPLASPTCCPSNPPHTIHNATPQPTRTSSTPSYTPRAPPYHPSRVHATALLTPAS